jgi:4-hydroxy-tetrahydrodipicolinate synthase
MPNQHKLSGVYAAVVTPLHEDGTLDQSTLPSLLEFLANRGCHGALLLGTTGEGPSFAPNERITILRAALDIRHSFPEFRLLAGTGTPSLEETIALTRASFDLGYDGVVVLPPYYYRHVSDDGLFAWFSQVILQAVPDGKLLLGYHIPGMSGVPLSIALLENLKNSFPHRFAGLKDSSGDPENARKLGSHFGDDLFVFTGNDRLFSHALQANASGCITALANIASPLLRQVWDTFQMNQDTTEIQENLNKARAILEANTPFPPVLKSVLTHQYNFPNWTVLPPLVPFPTERAEGVAADISAILK